VGQVELLTALDRGSHAEPAWLTTAAFLREQWLPGLRAQVRPCTWAEHKSKVEVQRDQMASVRSYSRNPSCLTSSTDLAAHMWGTLLAYGVAGLRM
jgi:hypothetical protein